MTNPPPLSTTQREVLEKMRDGIGLMTGFNGSFLLGISETVRRATRDVLLSNGWIECSYRDAFASLYIITPLGIEALGGG